MIKVFNNVEEQQFKIFEVNIPFININKKLKTIYYQKKGIEIRVNRSIQVEGAFANTKQNLNYTRIKRRGLDKADTEIMLTLLGQNIQKLFKYYETNTLPSFWKTTQNLESEHFKKLSAKRLTKQGQKINDKFIKK